MIWGFLAIPLAPETLGIHQGL